MVHAVRGWKPSLALSFAVFSVFVCALATALCIVDLMHARAVAVGVARREAEILSHSLTQQVGDTFDAADGALRTLATGAESGSERPAQRTRLRETMGALLATMPRIRAFSVSDERGRVIATASSGSAPHADSVFDLPAFRYHREHAGTGIFISASATGSTDAAARILVTRRLERPNGDFAGIALAAIDARSLGQLFETADVGRAGTIALVADDDTVLIRRPRASVAGSDRTIDKSSDPYVAYMAASYVSESAGDGARRLFAFERFARYPLRVVVGLAEGEYLAAWRADAIANYAALAFGTALIGALASGLGVQIARRKRAESALASLPVDVLTGLASRGRFDTELAREWRMAANDRMPLGLIVIDVGNLKAYNDRYGREEGDELLIAIARTISSLVSPSDLAARYSGLELAVILPTTDDAAARATAERLRSAIVELVARLIHTNSALVNVTVGAAALVPSSSADPTSIVDAAFIALQRSQRQTPGNAPTLLPDALTGLANRRHFDAELEREWQRSAQDATPLGLLMIEIENLNAYNDRHGHEAGDELLILITTTISRIAAPTQLVARYRGLECAVILPATDQAAAAHLAGRIAGAARELAALRAEPPATRVTLNVGASSLVPTGQADVTTLVRAASRALELAKGAGATSENRPV